MNSRRKFIQNSVLASTALMYKKIIPFNLEQAYITKRPAIEKRNFTSTGVNQFIAKAKAKIKDPELAWLFENCYPNTLDTTVEHEIINNIPDTYVITGDIDAMWLRDSTAQITPYLPFVKEDQTLAKLVEGVINRQKNVFYWIAMPMHFIKMLKK